MISEDIRNFGRYNWFDFYTNGMKLLYFNPASEAKTNIVLDDASFLIANDNEFNYGPIQYESLAIANQTYPAENYQQWKVSYLPMTTKISGVAMSEQDVCLNRNLNEDGTVKQIPKTATVDPSKNTKIYRSKGNLINNIDVSKIVNFTCTPRKRKNEKLVTITEESAPKRANVLDDQVAKLLFNAVQEKKPYNYNGVNYKLITMTGDIAEYQSILSAYDFTNCVLDNVLVADFIVSIKGYCNYFKSIINTSDSSLDEFIMRYRELSDLLTATKSLDLSLVSNKSVIPTIDELLYTAHQRSCGKEPTKAQLADWLVRVNQ